MAGARPQPVGVHWDLRLRNWALWAAPVVNTGYCLSRAAPSPSGATPNERDAVVVESLLCRMKLHRKPLYRIVWQTYLLRRDDVTAAGVLRIDPEEYRARVEAAWRWLAMAERGRRGARV